MTRGPAGWRQARPMLAGPLRTLVTGQILGQGGDGFAQIAFAQVVLFEAGRGATPWEITKLLTVTLLPFSLVGPFAGVVIDRWDRRRTMVTVSLFRVVLVLLALGVLVTDSQAPAYVGVVLLLSSSRFVLAAKGAALPRTVPAGADLVTANAVSSVAGLLAAFLGAVVGSTFVAVAPAAGFVVAGTCYLGAATRFRRLPPVGGGEAPAPLIAGLRRVTVELVEGLTTVATVPTVRRPLVAVWGHRFLLGAGFVVLVLIADERYSLEAPGYGLALAVTGVAAFGGTVAAPVLAHRFRRRALLPPAYLVSALAALLAGFRPSLVGLVAGLGAVAFAFQVLKVVVDALVQDAADDRVRGRVFAAYDVLYNVAFVVAGLALVPLWEPERDHLLLWWLAAGFAIGGLLLARSLRTWPFEPHPGPAPAPGPRRWWWRAGALVLGALPALAFPEPALSWLGFVGVVPLLLLVAGAPSTREAAWRAWLGAAGLVLACTYWLIPNIGPFELLLAAGLGALLVPSVLLARSLVTGPPTASRLVLAVVLAPCAWVAAEYVRSWQSLGGPWALLGASQWNERSVLALASLGGVWLVSLLLAAVNVAVAAALVPRRPWRHRAAALLVAGVLVAASVAYGTLRPDPPASGTVRVAGVQPGVVRGPERRFEANHAATLELAGTAPDLVVWGESSIGFDIDERPDLTDRVAEASRAVGADVLVNVDARRGEGGIFKSSVLVGPDGPDGRYDKMRLVPFGEYIPLRPVLGWLSGITEAAGEDRRRGDGLVVLGTDGLAIGPLVCFESSFPDLSRHLARTGADLVVVQSSTSTFQESWAPEQHASLAALRAVETGRPVVHATLTGVSAAFDARGRRLLWMGTDERGTWEVTLPRSRETTPFVRMGDWVPLGALGALLLAAITAALRAGRRTLPVPTAPDAG